MKSHELNTIAAALLKAGAPSVPTVILTREAPLFEVELTALEFAEEAKLPSTDWAALALARALGEVSPADVDAYLGLGQAVSESLVRRLLGEGLLKPQDVRTEPSAKAAEDSGIGALIRRLLGQPKAAPVETVTAATREPTAARRLYESRAASEPVCRLSSAGVEALDHGAVPRQRVRPGRLLFLADPLLFVRLLDEKRHRHSQHRRPNVIEPDRVPKAFQTLDTTLALAPTERAGACGIEEGIPGFSGRFVGIVPGAQWEVRPSGGKGRESQVPLLILAAFLSSDADGLTWRAYLREHEQTLDCPHVDGARFLGAELRSLRFLDTLEFEGPRPTRADLRFDGAFEIRADATLLPSLQGEADRPADTFLPARAAGWNVGVRAHASPLDAPAARAAFYSFLQRRDALLRRDFDGTCAEVAATLAEYWGGPVGLPSADDAASALWARAEFRSALCMRRRHRDLVAPYEPSEVANER